MRNARNIGFTLLEVMIVVVICILLALLIIPAIHQARRQDRENEMMQEGALTITSLVYRVEKSGNFEVKVEETKKLYRVKEIFKFEGNAVYSFSHKNPDGSISEGFFAVPIVLEK